MVVIGGAAFTYNFVKKRKQKKAAPTENGGSTTLQKDTENGTELKPLMNNAQEKKTIVEYTDEKQKTAAN